MQYRNDTDILMQTTSQMATVVERMEARSHQALQLIESGATALDQSARRLSGAGEQLAGDALRVIGEKAQQTLSQGVAQAANEFSQHLRQSAETAKQAAEALAEQRRLLSMAQRALVWKGLMALAMGSVLVAAGCGFYVWNSLREVKNAGFAQSILRATQTGVLTPCGDGALCIKVGKQPQLAGKDGEYVVLVD
jgi:hypothetical protein